MLKLFKWLTAALTIPVLLFGSTDPAFTQDLAFAELGSCELLNGKQIEECRIGYRTLGTLNEERSNVVLFTTWLAGRSESLASSALRMVDTENYFVVLVDALGNGVSSSPSNSPTQPGSTFPEYTIADMVHSQHRLLTEELGIRQLYAVMGLSMGGFQAFQWAVSYPEIADKAVSITGTPVVTPSDILLWKTQLQVMEAFNNGRIEERTAGHMIGAIHANFLYTAEYLNQEGEEAVLEMLDRNRESAAGFDNHDYASQLRAVLGQDIYEYSGTSPESIGQILQTDILVSFATHDQMVHPAPAREFVLQTGMPTFEMKGPCGHLAPGCEREELTRAVRDFLEMDRY